MLNMIKKNFSLDVRSLGLYRILLGLILMLDTLSRFGDRRDFYTDFGLISRDFFLTQMSLPWSFSLHYANGSETFVTLMLLLQLWVGFLVLMGYKTRWMIFFSFIFNVSIHNRNWLINNGGDDILRSILFISIFLPLATRFSVDEGLRKNQSEEKQSLSFWTSTYLIQVFCVYFFSYLLKDHFIWREEFSAFFYSSRLDIFATPLTIWMREFDSLGVIITKFSIYLEWLGPLLLLFSFLTFKFFDRLRLSLVLLFMSFHFGIFLTMNIGLFPFIGMLIWIPFIPSSAWDFLGNKFKKQGLILFYDEDCLFCEKMVHILKSLFLPKEVIIKPAQSDVEVNKIMLEKNSWVVSNESGEFKTSYDGILELISHSPFLCWTYFFWNSKPLRVLGAKSYLFVSTHRQLMARWSQYLIFKPVYKKNVALSFLYESLGLFILVSIFSWNLATIKRFNLEFPRLADVVRFLHLYQEWNMFSPFPKMDNIWVEVPATFSNADHYEYLTGRKNVDQRDSMSFYASIPNEHWRKYYLNLSEKPEQLANFGRFLCFKEMNPSRRLKNFEINIYSQMNLPSGDKGEIKKIQSWIHQCYE